jgi:hypothetical protein
MSAVSSGVEPKIPGGFHCALTGGFFTSEEIVPGRRLPAGLAR